MSETTIAEHNEKSFQNELDESIKLWHAQVAELLPALPADIKVEFDSEYLVPELGVGGAAFGPNTLKLAYDAKSGDTYEQLITKLRPIYFHESFHLARGVSYATTPHDLPAIANAVEEGLATKFEVVHTSSRPGYDQYEDRETMLAWLKEVRGLPDGFDYEWQRWKFFDPETGRKWILYKVGMFIVDEALRNNPHYSVEKLSTLSVENIIDMSSL